MVSYQVIGLIKDKLNVDMRFGRGRKPYIFLEFNITIKQEKYLGICMTKINWDLCKNYLPTWKRVTTNWGKLSWLGKTTTVKISILLRFNFLTQMSVIHTDIVIK